MLDRSMIPKATTLFLGTITSAVYSKNIGPENTYMRDSTEHKAEMHDIASLPQKYHHSSPITITKNNLSKGSCCQLTWTLVNTHSAILELDIWVWKILVQLWIIDRWRRTIVYTRTVVNKVFTCLQNKYSHKNKVKK